MTHRATALARAADNLVGTRFRLQGRDPAHGLDCIGVVLASLAAIGVRIALPADYRPQRRSISIPHDALAAAGLTEARGSQRAGDVLLLRIAPAQVHAAVAVGAQVIVHAHAGLGRVVRAPVPGSWAPIGIWRLDCDPQDKGDTQWQR